MTSSAQPPKPRKIDPLGAPWPDLIPLRPLTIGEIFGAAIALVRRNAAILCGLSLIVGIISSGAVLAFLANRPDLDVYLTGSWSTDMVESGTISFPAVVFWPLAIGLLVPLIGTTVVSALATVFATEMAIGKVPTGAAVRQRLAGRWWVIFAVAILGGLIIGIGFVLIIVPGLIALGMLSLAGPVAVIEGGRPIAALRRSIRLSRPVMWRIVGVVLLSGLITTVVGMVISGIIGGLNSNQDWTSIVVTEIVVALVGAVMTPWSAAVIAVLYIDTRMRTEGLAGQLHQAAERARLEG
ncbi:hypothetical protein D1871_05310 [Nakamurella silvestris]|nr:hypothetical protein D1871_05310 [Nakamurella silvestris]